MTRRFSFFILAALVAFALPVSAAKKKPAPDDDSDAAPVAKAVTFAKKKTAPAAAPAKKEVPEAFPAQEESGPPAIQAASAIVLDAQTGKVLFEHNADDARPVASTQKLLTGLIIAEEGGLDSSVRVAAIDGDAEPSKLYIKSGECYERGKLLTVLLIKSMNDVARCLARDNAGSIDGFAAKMNAKAALLGMHTSHFLNPNGLPAPGQYSTARDMSKVALAAYRNRVIRSIVCQRLVTWHYNDGRVRSFESTNLVLRKWPLCNGMKTGYTEAAGHCLIASASYHGRDIITVVLGDKKVWDDSYRLLSWGLSS
ncbi:MAG TPA: D-alanyl-D-alanine carboxypeptidase family protein [Chthoniobacteraceae bacterium]|nr:D-alanyl-D-alanine carboxypeptidase family protein [Chthoniobacteraceae bacterium]